MSQPSPSPSRSPCPTTWTPEQAWFVHALLEDLIEQIEAHDGAAVQQWLGDWDAEEQAFRECQSDLFEDDFNDPLPF